MDLYSDDIQDERSYPGDAILSAVRALIKAGQREGTMIEYKSAISEKDNWPEAAAAFLNTFGGLMIFGVEGKGGQPRRMTGFDPQGVETKTRLTSMLLSRIQPRPEFQIRVVTHDVDQAKEVAILRIPEGSQPPYIHSKEHEHRVYLRAGAQKAEADYLQLSALFEKRRKVESKAELLLLELIGGQSQLYVGDPANPNQANQNRYMFVLAPDDDRASRRLTNDVEQQFKRSFERLFPQSETSPIRTAKATYFRYITTFAGDQRFAITSQGALGFATHAFVKSSEVGSQPSPLFMVDRFYRDLINFIASAASFYEKSSYFGGNLLSANLLVRDSAKVFRGNGLFTPPLETIQGLNATAVTHVSLQPATTERLAEYLEAMVNELARSAGSIVTPSFRAIIQPDISFALGCLRNG